MEHVEGLERVATCLWTPVLSASAGSRSITEVQQIGLDSPKLPFNSGANTLNRYWLE
jgi:hypothetical protein